MIFLSLVPSHYFPAPPDPFLWTRRRGPLSLHIGTLLPVAAFGNAALLRALRQDAASEEKNLIQTQIHESALSYPSQSVKSGG